VKILVTGSAGFIGYHVARALCAEGVEVVGLDNFNDYYDVRLKRARDAALRSCEGFTPVEMECADHERLARLFETHRFDRVCHLAAQAGVRYSLTNPFAYTHANVTAHLSILEACRHYPVQRLVYASSSSVYGGNKKVPFSEVDAVDHPVSLYAATKKADELMAHCYTHLYDIQTVGLRFFTVYGPWGRPDMAMWLFTDAILHGRPIRVFNHGDMRRDFTYIDDIVQGVRAALFADGLGSYEVFNLGNHRSEALLDCIATIEDTLGTTAHKRMEPMQPGDVKETYADIARAHDKLGFTPATPIAEGIPRFIAWFREYHGI
jgi:UDP-glucuronate 4-epimerase